ncbi:thioesterase II family protein [Actinoplanes sp. N902-109]|uniref:thioesterase II family protein n=1 Tax=Actinoplanes sp. (strain N902-109) TaxID=649831 RepID=UPI0003295AC3|nr:alpha/beta fold hydrolase [Actinoplanes sp. N902-109]AGL15997.1 thioesterase [Actinoplanes sp. N902-109]
MTTTATTDALWLRRFRPASAPTARLVCLPHAGGSAAYFLPVSVALSPGIDVVSVQYPGRQDRRHERPIDDVALLADRIADILSREDDLPLSILGHSLGAALGFEVIRRLEAKGRQPVRLFASGRRAPSTTRNETSHKLNDDDLLAELGKLNGTNSSLLANDELMRAALPALRADLRAAELHGIPAQTKVNAAITVLTGDHDPKTTVAEAEAWNRHTTGAFDLNVLPGGHFFIADEAPAVLKILREKLNS